MVRNKTKVKTLLPTYSLFDTQLQLMALKLSLPSAFFNQDSTSSVVGWKWWFQVLCIPLLLHTLVF